MSSDHKSIAGLLLLRFAVTILLVWAMTTYLDAYFYVGGGWKAYVIVAALVTLLNVVLRPVITIILLPLRFFATFLAIIASNVFFLWVVRAISLQFDSALVTLDIKGILGWLLTGALFGFTNWLLTH